jgi:hypothetical protein
MLPEVSRQATTGPVRLDRVSAVSPVVSVLPLSW